MKPLLVVVSGPTAVGKTSLSVSLARHFNCPVISADSRQFYRELNIATAKPSPEEIKGVIHYFISHLSIHNYYNVSRFEQDVISLFSNHTIQSPLALLTGGSGLYTDAVCRGIDDIPDPDPDLRKRLLEEFEKNGAAYFHDLLMNKDPDTYNKIDKSNKNRLIRAVETITLTGKTLSEIHRRQYSPRPFRVLKIALDRPREELHRRINDRTAEMITAGLEKEARELYEFRHLNALNTVGYKELFDCFDGKYTLSDAIEKIKSNTRKYARRQLTWLRRDKEYKWFHPDQQKEITELIKHTL
jgi:tRNA dimethylallyltransferase